MTKVMSDYCIYLDAFSSDMSKEHIIPTSLGGLNSFCIQADRKFNNDVGAAVDGAIANDFLMLFSRDRAEAKGYSKRKPEPRAKRATLEDGTEVQVTFAKDGLRIFNSRERRYLNSSERSNRIIQVDGLTLDLNADIKFVAKVALAAGYFAYGDFFRLGVQHHHARQILNAESLVDIRPDVRLYTRFQSAEDLYDPTNLHLFKSIVEFSKCSCVMLIPGNRCFGVVVGILGEFMGMINIPADTADFPNSGDYALGHCIFLKDGIAQRISFREVCNDMLACLDKVMNRP